MAQDLTNFIPEVWSKKLKKILDNSGVMMGRVNKNYEGEIKKSGDTVHIRTFGDVTVKDYSGSITYEDLTSPTDTMTINQKKYFAFKVDDIAKAQSDIDIMAGYLDRAKVAIDLSKDTYLLSKVADAHADNVISTSVLTKNNIYAKFAGIAKLLKKANATSSGQKPWIIINPDIEDLLVQAPEFIQANGAGQKVIEEGHVGRVSGLEVYSCTNFSDVAGTFNIMAGTNDAITYASQVTEIETIRLQDSFDTAVRGLYVFDAKTILTKALVKAVFTLS
jgi:hypothetical protein